MHDYYYRLTEGLLRFRKALITNLILIVLLTIVFFYFSDYIMGVLIKPLVERELIFSGPGGTGLNLKQNSKNRG